DHRADQADPELGAGPPRPARRLRRGRLLLVAVADLAEVLDDRAERVLDLLELTRGQAVDEVPPHVLHVVRGDPLDGRDALAGEHGERAPLVALALVAPDQAAIFHPRDLMGEPAPGLAGGVGELGHSQPLARGLGQLDQDLVVVPVEPVHAQVPVELAQQQLGQVDGGAPRLLLVRAEPAWLWFGPGHNTNLPLSRPGGDSVSPGWATAIPRSPPSRKRAYDSGGMSRLVLSPSELA